MISSPTADYFEYADLFKPVPLIGRKTPDELYQSGLIGSRARIALKALGCKKLVDAARLHRDQFQRLQECGPTSIKQIRALLKNINLDMLPARRGMKIKYKSPGYDPVTGEMLSTHPTLANAYQ